METLALVSRLPTKGIMLQLNYRINLPDRRENQVLVILVCAFFLFQRAVRADSPDGAESLKDSFHYTLVGIAQVDGVSYASFIDQETGSHFLLSTNTKSESDVVLDSVQTENDPLGPAAIIRKGNASILLKMGSDSALTSYQNSPAAASLAKVDPAPNAMGSLVRSLKLKPPVGGALPLVFQEVDPKKMTLTDEQKATLNSLRQEFIDAINGANTGTAQNAPGQVAAPQTSDSTDQQLQNWASAQEKSDEQFRMLYGNQAFNAYTESIAYPMASSQN